MLLNPQFNFLDIPRVSPSMFRYIGFIYVGTGFASNSAETKTKRRFL